MSPEEFEELKAAADAGILRKLDRGRRRISLTGKLSMKRDDFKMLIRAVDGVWDEHPSWGTDYLIVGDTSIHGRTRKMMEAEQRGAKIISETDFIRMITPEEEQTIEQVRGW
jgi:NAD-dependent DNA ligase